FFKNGRFRINGFERSGNNSAISPAGRGLCRDQRSIRSSGLVWYRSASAAAVTRLAWVARPIHPRAKSKKRAIRCRQRDVSIPFLTLVLQKQRREDAPAESDRKP